MPRKQGIETGSVHHVFNRSIAGYHIFPKGLHYQRFQQMLRFFQWEDIALRFSHIREKDFAPTLKMFEESKKRRIEIICYCLMPNHFHLAIREVLPLGIERFMADLQNSYSKYFNLRHARKGPLWEGRFKNVACETDDQLLHLTRYIHLNPVTANLATHPEDWAASSYLEYLNQSPISTCRYDSSISISPSYYAHFVNSRIEDQKTLARIKALLLD